MTYADMKTGDRAWCRHHQRYEEVHILRSDRKEVVFTRKGHIRPTQANPDAFWG